MATTTTHPSPLRNSSLYSPPSSPTQQLRAPPRSRSTSPELAKRSTAAGVEIISTAKGAEGGAGAIGVRRRESNSFKTMSTGSLVSNSPFTKRLNGANNTTTTTSSPTTSLYSGSRIPTSISHTRSASVSSAIGGIERKTSGGGTGRKTSGGRKVSGEEQGPKENRRTSIDSVNGASTTPSPVLDEGKASGPASPAVPFRPTRNGHGHSHSVSYSASSFSAGIAAPGNTSPFKPSRSPVDEQPGPRRTSSSFSAVKKNGLVSSSPFVANGGAARPLPTPTSPRKPAPSSLSLDSAPSLSPPLRQAPYEIPPLQKESAPFNVYPSSSFSDETDDLSSQSTVAPSKDATTAKPLSIGTMGMGMGVRPAGFPSTPRGRMIAGSSAPPPLTPPSTTNSPTTLATAANTAANNNMSTLPSGVLSASRRTRGPRAITPSEDEDENNELDGEETETEESASARRRKVIRRQPSAKTVTWATEEEVLEFEVEDEEEEERRRMSVASWASGSSGTSMGSEAEDAEGYYEHRQAEDSMTFEEGGSVEVHDVDTSEEEEEEDEGEDGDEASSVVEDMIGEIENFMFQDDHFTSPNSRFTVDDDDEGSPVLTEGARNLINSNGTATAPISTTTTAIKTGTTSTVTRAPVSAFSNATDETTSESSYDDEEEDADDLFQVHTATSTIISTATASVAPPSTALNAYSLPDLPENSPFLAFEDDGIASSVVTLDLAPKSPARFTTSTPAVPASTGAYLTSAGPTAPLQSTPLPSPLRVDAATTPTPAPAATPTPTPIRASEVGTFGIFQREQSPEIPLSRQASILDSESTVSVSSVSGSQRGRFKLGREQFQERIKLQEALLESATPPPSTMTAPPTPTSSTRPNIAPPSTASTTSSIGPLFAEMNKTRSLPSAIPARPAPKARSATLSSGMLTTVRGTDLVVGSEITSEVAGGMQSPLERLGGELAKSGGGEEVETEDSEVGRIEVGESQEKKGGRRRSLSTGDVEIEATGTSTSMERYSSMPEYSYKIETSRAAEDIDFADGLEDSLSHILQRDRKYHVREAKKIVYANDGLVETSGKAGDVDPGRAWRKKRPSDVHISRSNSSKRDLGSRKENLSGEVFVKVICADFLDLPIPHTAPTMVEVELNKGKQTVKAGMFELNPVMQVGKEFALMSNAALEFRVALRVHSDATQNPHLTQAPMLSPIPVPDSPSKTSRFFTRLASPKKMSANKRSTSSSAPPVVPDRLLQHVDGDNILASASCSFRDHANACRMKRTRVQILLVLGSSPTARKASGSLTLDLLWVPSVPGTNKNELPQSMAAAEEGLRMASEQAVASHEGELTQMGGDCKTPRRRLFRLRGARLIPYNEVTKRAFVEIDLNLAVGIDDPDKPQATGTMKRSPSMEDEDSSLWRMANSFKILFRDGTDISFVADSAEAKAKWLECLAKAGASRAVAAPLWAERCLKFRKAS